MTTDVIELEFLDNEAIAAVRLNRPLRRNALNPECLLLLQKILTTLKKKYTLRALILSGNGADFCAGADLEWMKASRQFTEAQNVEDAQRIADVLQTLQSFPKPTIAIAHGSVFGGGLGLVACCDMVLASAEVQFCFSEVKLGLIPAIIAPFMAEAMSLRQMQRYCLTAEVFGAEPAWRCGLVHEIHAEAALWDEAVVVARRFSQYGPKALTETKQLLQHLRCEKGSGTSGRAKLIKEMVHKIAKIRVSKEAQEGMAAFLEKRAPHYV